MGGEGKRTFLDPSTVPVRMPPWRVSSCGRDPYDVRHEEWCLTRNTVPLSYDHGPRANECGTPGTVRFDTEVLAFRPRVGEWTESMDEVTVDPRLRSGWRCSGPWIIWTWCFL